MNKPTKTFAIQFRANRFCFNGFGVGWKLAPYSGNRVVRARNAVEAVCILRASIRKDGGTYTKTISTVAV